MFEYDASWDCVDTKVAYLTYGESKWFKAHPDATKLTVHVAKKNNGMTIEAGWLRSEYLSRYGVRNIYIERNTWLGESEPTY